MSLGRCLTDLRDSGAISEDAFERLRPRYEELVTQYEPLHGRNAAESMATDKALEWAEAEFSSRKRQMLAQAKAQEEWIAGQYRARLARAGGDPDKMQPFDREHAEEFINQMDAHRDGLRSRSWQMNSGLLEQHRRGVTGKVRNADDMLGVLDEISGRDTGSLNARELADGWRQQEQWHRHRYNAAGGRLAKNDAWFLPQRHDVFALREAGRDNWVDFMMGARANGQPRLNRAAMLDRDTGLPLDDAKLEQLLRDMWETVTARGWDRANPGELFEGATGNSRTDPRFIYFADPEAWLEYAEVYGGYGEGAGGAAVLDAMQGHVESMVRDTAAMDFMGPNPNATLRFMQDWIAQQGNLERRAGKAGVALDDEISAAQANVQHLFDLYTGTSRKPVKRGVALKWNTFRGIQVAAKLPAATLSVGGDFGLMKLTADFNGLSTTKLMGEYFTNINPANARGRAQASRLDLMASTWTEGHAAIYRTLGEEVTHEGVRRVSQFTLRASGLSAHTDIAQQAVAHAVFDRVTEYADVPFAQLKPKFRAMLERYDIRAVEWDNVRAAEPMIERGVAWLNPEAVARAGHERLADNMMRMAVTEARFAVPVPDLRTRNVIEGIGRRGTHSGEAAKSTFLFKGFPLAVMNMHGRRMLQAGMSQGQVNRFIAGKFLLRYGAKLLVMTTMGGALSLQAKELHAGRDPLPMNTGSFWLAAMLQGGGLGIFGDFLFAAENRFGGGVAETLTGPGAQTADTLIDLGVGQPMRMADDDPENDDHWKRSVAKLLTREVPVINMWYSRALVETVWHDTINEWAYGDDLEAHYRRLERYANERGTSYYAPPGSNPNEWRMPNFGNVFGAASEDAASEDTVLLPPVE